MGKRFVTLLLAFTVTVSAWAESRIYGYDALGMAMYCQTFLQAPKLPGLSTLLATFGDPLPCVEKRIAQGGLTDVQVDLIDATCWRNGVCPPGAPKPDDLKVIENRSRQVMLLAIGHPQVTFWVSPALEHDVKSPARVRQMMEAALKGCTDKAGVSHCQLINSPFSGATLPDVPTERHGNSVKSFSVSNDGASLFDSNSPQYRLNGTRFVFGWWNRLNLRYTGEKTFTPPLKRTCKPSADSFRQGNLLLQEPQQKPAIKPAKCKSVRDVTAKEIWKTNSEDFCSNDPRSDKAVLITKLKDNRFSLINSQSKEIGCLKYYGSFSGIPGSYRHYIGTCSGQTPAKLFDAAGGEWLWLKRDNGECILVNSIRRLGSFR